jgi:hypothetical protein
MGRSRRLVLLDPGLSRAVGHHADVNALLLPILQQAGWQPELWADADAEVPLLGLRPFLQDAGYIDPRHWCDLAGCLHQATRLRRQLEPPAAVGEPVTAWLAHSLLPFQLIALAQLLQHQPSARVLICLMFAPGEVFAGQPDHDLQAQRQAAEALSSAALAALALAVQRAGHQLLLATGSQQQIARYAPLCAASGLPEPQLHPAITGAASELELAGNPTDTASAGGRQILLHWGERKPDKGREQALALLERRLEREPPAALAAAQWCFHASGDAPAGERALLERAAAHPQLRILEGHQPRAAMVHELASSDLALLAYCPIAYAERSSGVLWLYGAARLAAGRPAHVAGYAGGWLAAEAEEMGMGWRPLPRAATVLQMQETLAAAVEATSAAREAAFTPYGKTILGQPFANWVVKQLAADKLT